MGFGFIFEAAFKQMVIATKILIWIFKGGVWLISAGWNRKEGRR